MKLKSIEGGCFLAGLAIGAGSAVLMAPKSGTETVADLKRKARQSVDSLKHEMNAAGCHLKDTVKETMERGKKAIRQQTENLSAAVEAGRRAYHDAATSETIKAAARE